MTNQDGRSADLTAPSGPSQNAIMLLNYQKIDHLQNGVSITERCRAGATLDSPIKFGAMKLMRNMTQLRCPSMLLAFKSDIRRLEVLMEKMGITKCVGLRLRKLLTPDPCVSLSSLHARFSDCLLTLLGDAPNISF